MLRHSISTTIELEFKLVVIYCSFICQLFLYCSPSTWVFDDVERGKETFSCGQGCWRPHRSGQLLRKQITETLQSLSLYICMYICMYVCICVYICIVYVSCMYIVYAIIRRPMYVCRLCMHVCVYVKLRMYVRRTYVCTTCTYVCMHVCMYVCMYV